MSLVASPILLDSKVTSKINCITYSCPSPRALLQMNGSKTHSGAFANSEESAIEASGRTSPFFHSPRISPVKRNSINPNNSVRSQTPPTSGQIPTRIDEEKNDNTKYETSISEQSMTGSISDFLISPDKRPRTDRSESVSTSLSAGLPCPCGKQFSDSVIFVEHARQCEEFALTANSFAEAAAAVASATNGPKSASVHSSESSPCPRKSTTPTNCRLDKTDINSPGNSSNCTEIGDPVGKTAVNVGSSGTGHKALDLSVRSQDLQSSTSSPDAVFRKCPECKYTHSNLTHLYQHIETEHDIRGIFECECGEHFTWLPTLVKHRLYCTTQHNEQIYHSQQHHNHNRTNVNSAASSELNSMFNHPVRSPSFNRTSSDFHSRTDWLSGTHVAPTAKSLQCTACGKTGFLAPNEMANHFTMCSVLTHRSRSPNLGLPLSPSPLTRHTLNGAGSVGQWTSPTGSAASCVSSLYCTMSTTTSPTSAGPNRSDRGYSPPGYPFGFLPPLGYSPYSKQFSPKSTLPSYSSKPISKTMPKSNEMRSTSMVAKDTHNHLIQSSHHHHHHHHHNINQGSASGSGSANHTDHPTNPDLTRPFKCCHCIKAFKSKALLDQHMHIHYPPKYTCRYCAKKYRWPPVFYHHQRTCKKRPPSTSASTTNGNSAASVEPGASTTATAGHTFHTRPTDSNGATIGESSVFSLPAGYFFSPPLEHHSSSNQSSSQNGPSQHTHHSRLPHPFPFSPSSHTNLHGHPFGPDLFSASLAAFYDPLSMGANTACPGLLGGMVSSQGGMGSLPNPGAMLAAAAACAAMGIRVPFGHALPPPPLGFNPPYNPGATTSNALSFGQAADPTTIFSSLMSPSLPTGASTTVAPSTPHSSAQLMPSTPLTPLASSGNIMLPNPIPVSSASPGMRAAANSSNAVGVTGSLFNPIHPFTNSALFLPTNGPSINEGAHISSNGAKSTADGYPLESSRGLLCVCGQQFGTLPTYLNHLANCVTLQRLVQPLGNADDVDPVASMTTVTKTTKATTPTYSIIPTTDPVSVNRNGRSPPRQKSIINEAEALLFSSAAMAAMNAIMSRTKSSSSDSGLKEDQSGKELISTGDSGQNDLSESIWSTDRCQQNLSQLDAASPKMDPKSDQEDSSRVNNSQRMQSFERTMKLSPADSQQTETKPDMTLKNTPIESTEVEFGELNPLVKSEPTLNSRSSRPNIASPGTSSHTGITDSTNLMAAMASVLANAAVAAGFPNLPDELSTSMSDISGVRIHGTESENTSGMDSTMIAFMMNGSMHAKLCLQCGKEFSSRLSLKQHVEGKHSVEGKYQCPGCAKRYRWGASYYYHKKSCPAIRESSPMSTDQPLGPFDERDVNESTPPPPLPQLARPQTSSRQQSIPNSPQDELDQENSSDELRGRSDLIPSPLAEAVRERTNSYIFNMKQDLLADPLVRFRPLSFPLDMRHDEVAKTEDHVSNANRRLTFSL